MFGNRKTFLTLPVVGMIAFGLAPMAGDASTAGDVTFLNVLNTSPLVADAGSYHACNIVNVSTSSVSVSIALINSGGFVIASATNLVLQAGVSTEINVGGTASNGTDPGLARCRFTIQDNPAVIRANETLSHYDNTTGLYQTYAISEAR